MKNYQLFVTNYLKSIMSNLICNLSNYLAKQVALISFILFATTSHAQGLVINEFMASNAQTVTDATGNHEDWIELYNGSNTSIDLNGYHISDNPVHLTRHKIDGSLIIPAGGYVIIWASNVVTRGINHTNFSLSRSGDFIALTAPDGNTIIDSISFTQQYTDISMGRETDGGNHWVFFNSPTPNAQNDTVTAYNEILDPPTFSHTGGFYANPFSLSLTHPDNQVDIYYTLDGSDPNPDRVNGFVFSYKNQYKERPNTTTYPLKYDTVFSFAYQAPISLTNRTPSPNHASAKNTTYVENPTYIPSVPVQKGNIVRAIAVKSGAISSEIRSHTYFIGNDLLNRYSFPVISLGIGQEKLFDYDEGYHCAGKKFEDWRVTTNDNVTWHADFNWKWRGREYERPMSFEYFETNGMRMLGHQVGARLHGGGSRLRNRKAFRIYARNQYNQSSFDHPFFTHRNDDSFKRLIIRNSGSQDAYYTQFRDAAAQDIVKHLAFDMQYSEPHIVFINGEYWGIYNLREFQNRHYLKRLYDVESNEIDLLSWNYGKREEVDGDSLHFDQMIEFAKDNDLSADSLFEMLSTFMDVDDFTDYVLPEVYFGNDDWPQNNVKAWRKRVAFTPNAARGHDGRWRWLMYDVDYAFGRFGGVAAISKNTLEHAKNNADIGILLTEMWENESYQHYFANRYADLMNTCLRAQHINATFDSLQSLYDPEINEHIQRWSEPSHKTTWVAFINQMRTYANNRAQHARSHLMDEFQIQSIYNVQIDVNDTTAGIVKINTIDIQESTPGISSSPYPWAGIYFQNIPIDLVAKPKPGYRFTHWEIGDSIFTDQSVTVTLYTSTSITAYFEPGDAHGCLPSTHPLNDCPFIFTFASSHKSHNHLPESLRIVYFDQQDPNDNAAIEGEASGPLNLNSKTRTVGLKDNGLAFLNTSSQEGNIGFPATKLGGLLVDLNTLGVQEGYIQWEGGTVEANSRVYHIRLQYRTSDSTGWIDVLDSLGSPVEYQRQQTYGHSSIIGPIALPSGMLNKECVQLLWRYYYTGIQNDPTDNTRDMLRVGNIIVSSGALPSSGMANAYDLYDEQPINGSHTGREQQFTPYNINNAAKTFWVATNGTVITGQGSNAVNVRWDKAGVGAISVYYEDINGCKGFAQQIVDISISNLLFHLDDGIKIYPNPGTGNYYLLNLPPKKLTAKLTNLKGAVIETHHTNGKSEDMIVLKAASGVYSLIIVDEEGHIVHREKIIHKNT